MSLPYEYGLHRVEGMGNDDAAAHALCNDFLVGGCARLGTGAGSVKLHGAPQKKLAALSSESPDSDGRTKQLPAAH